MIAKMFIAISILLLLTTSSLTAGQDEPVSCESHTVTCVCGIGENKTYVPLVIEMFAVEDSTTGKLKCEGHPDPYQACANISCVFTLNGSNSHMQFNDILSYFHPQEFTIPAGGFPKGHRSLRQIERCHIPVLKNAEVKCWKWPNWMNCDINCIHGYALHNLTGTATTKNVHCRNSENVWKPHEFQDCQPFLNCGVQLVKPGNLKCVEPINGPAYCDISCLDYGDYEPTSLQKYECIDDSFGRSLPHCATLKKEVSLIKKPENPSPQRFADRRLKDIEMD